MYSLSDGRSMLTRYRLLEHAQNKHNKGIADCFPGVTV